MQKRSMKKCIDFILRGNNTSVQQVAQALYAYVVYTYENFMITAYCFTHFIKSYVSRE